MILTDIKQLKAKLRQSEDGREGEWEIDLDIPEGVSFDLDSSDDGTIYVQWWTVGDEQ